ncbi:MAG: DUF2306 domain-containing protein [Phycisphaerales bacterium]
MHARMARAGWWTMAVLSALVGVASWRFLFVDAGVLYADHAKRLPGSPGPHFYGLLRDHWLRFAGHFVFGPIALLVGPTQFLSGLRSRRPRLHRALGYVYVVSVLISGTAALALSAGSFGGLTTHVAFGMLAVMWVGATVKAVLAARARRFEEHRRWMVRSFALTLSAVTLRLWMPVFLVMGYSFEAMYQTVAWLSWVPNVLVAEWLLNRRRRN